MSDFSGYPNSWCPDPDAPGFGSATNRLWTGYVQRGKWSVDDAREDLLAAPGCPADFWPEGGKATGYVFQFSWAAMGRTNRPDRIGFNIGVQDDDGGGRRNHALYWTGNPARPFSDESAFGVLVLNE